MVANRDDLLPLRRTQHSVGACSQHCRVFQSSARAALDGWSRKILELGIRRETARGLIEGDMVRAVTPGCPHGSSEDAIARFFERGVLVLDEALECGIAGPDGLATREILANAERAT